MGLLEELMEHEGYRKRVYLDPKGYITGGYGHLVTHRDNINFIHSLSEKDAKKFWTEKLIEDMLTASFFVDRVTKDWEHPPTEIQREVLIELCFNLGRTGLLGFNKFLLHMSKGNIQMAAKELIDSKWHRDFVQWNSGRDTPNIRSRQLEKKLLGSINGHT